LPRNGEHIIIIITTIVIITIIINYMNVYIMHPKITMLMVNICENCDHPWGLGLVTGYYMVAR